MVHLARTAGRNPVTIQQISEAEKLTPAYVAKLLRLLRNGKLVVSAHGPAGGYRLPRSPEEISVADILHVLGGRLFKPGHCARYPGVHSVCAHSTACSIRPFLTGLDLIVDRVLARTRLRDLTDWDRPLPEWIRAQIPSLLEAASGAEGPASITRGGPGS